jgi:hypothetical protein
MDHWHSRNAGFTGRNECAAACELSIQNLRRSNRRTPPGALHQQSRNPRRVYCTPAVHADVTVGQVLMKDIRFDPTSGQLLTGSFMDYAMPRADTLSAIDCEDHPVPTQTNPLGVKGAGEAGNVGALPAVANALVNALDPLGIRDVPMPATPERLWHAMTNAQQ